MLAHQIICMACKYQGSFDTQEVSIENARPDCSKYLGHDPFTSAMHYQCPQCYSCVNVDPMDIFKMHPAEGQPVLGFPGKDTNSIPLDTDFLWQLTSIIKHGMLVLTRYVSKNIGLSL